MLDLRVVVMVMAPGGPQEQQAAAGEAAEAEADTSCIECML
jgi:hypothetical protein